ncbi:uncharacterized protein LOC126266735 [Schistocerca gregaria]|uniref:uncharacterized protein LOC126266735 n=1 Tax=Schistocerca gregaria TaxID=7010 RepID=UPI00211F318A|nr:uncharacterized protein LOC126266735 [Schistocerca gregaria]
MPEAGGRDVTSGGAPPLRRRLARSLALPCACARPPCHLPDLGDSACSLTAFRRSLSLATPQLPAESNKAAVAVATAAAADVTLGGRPEAWTRTPSAARQRGRDGKNKCNEEQRKVVFASPVAEPCCLNGPPLRRPSGAPEEGAAGEPSSGQQQPPSSPWSGAGASPWCRPIGGRHSRSLALDDAQQQQPPPEGAGPPPAPLPPPPPPPASPSADPSADEESDPVWRAARFLRTYYRELAAQEPSRAPPPPWAPQLPAGALHAAAFEPALQLAPLRPGEPEPRDRIRADQLLAPLRTSDGSLLEAPRRVLVEGAPGSGKTALALRLLHGWAAGGVGGGGGDAWPGAAGVRLALLVPLHALRRAAPAGSAAPAGPGCSLAHYLTRELLPKAVAAPSLWKSLPQLEERLLVVVDGGEGDGEGEGDGDAAALLSGRLLPDCRLLVTARPGRAGPHLLQRLQRRVALRGLDWQHVERLVVAYFGASKKPECASRFLEVVGGSHQVLRPLASWPLGWLLLCVLFEEEGGRLPADSLEVHHALFKCIVRRSLHSRGVELPPGSELPGHCKKLLAEFGKLALSCIKEDRYTYTDAEIRTHCHGLEVLEMGFLRRGLAPGQRPGSYSPLARSLADFLAAYYLSSVVHYANILRRELDELPGLAAAAAPAAPAAAADSPTVVVVLFLVGLLGRKAHLVFNQLCPLDFPTRTLFSLLQAAGPSEANVAAVCRLVGAGPGPPPPPPLVRTAALELQGWAHVLRSDACALPALELSLQLQLDAGADAGAGADADEAAAAVGWAPRDQLDAFFAALAANESVRAVRVSSLLGQEPGAAGGGAAAAAELARLAGHVRATLAKPRLAAFELAITCLEDSTHDRFQPLVDALCASLEVDASPSLSKLVLDLNMGTRQVAQLCAALRRAPQVSVLQLPHLVCGREGLRAVAALLRARPLLALSLAGSWGAAQRRCDDPPSSSGVSLGECGGGGGGGGTAPPVTAPVKTSGSPTSKVHSIGGCYYFSSLPRGAMAAYSSSLGRHAATLPRQPLALSLSGSAAGWPDECKRNSDSVLCGRLVQPAPACDAAQHAAASGFHHVFEAARDPGCQLRSLNVSKCLLGTEDALCLGETVRRSRSLAALRLEGAARLGEVLPALLGLADSASLQLLDLGSQRLCLDDGAAQLVCQALARNSTLRLLSLDGWTFRIEEEGSLAALVSLLRATGVRDLALRGCRLQLAVHEGPLAAGAGPGGRGRRAGAAAAAHLLAALPPFTCAAVLFLRLAAFQVTVNDRPALRGPLLLPFLRGFTHLSDLDLSLEKSSVSGTGVPLTVDDRALVTFFETLSASFRTLQSLRMSHWRLGLEDAERTLRRVGRALKACSLSHLQVDGLRAADVACRAPAEHLFLQAVVANLSYLTWLGAAGVPLSRAQAAALGRCVRDRFPGTALQLSARDMEAAAAKALVAALRDGGRLEVSFLAGGELRVQRVAKNPGLRVKLRRFTSLKE